MSFFDKMKNQSANPLAGSGNNTVQSRGNKSVDSTFADIPETYEAFCSLAQAAMATPFDTVAMTVVALCVYPMDQELSFRMLDFLRGPRPLTGVDKQFIADRFRDKDYVPRSYFNGAVPENDYMPTAPFVITVSENPHSYEEQGYAKLFISSGGADSPRPVKTRQAKDGKWYVWEYSSVLLGIREPESANPWA